MSAGPILNNDGGMTLQVSVHDITGRCRWTAHVRLGPYFKEGSSAAVKAAAERGLPSESDIITALKAAISRAELEAL